MKKTSCLLLGAAFMLSQGTITFADHFDKAPEISYKGEEQKYVDMYHAIGKKPTPFDIMKLEKVDHQVPQVKVENEVSIEERKKKIEERKEAFEKQQEAFKKEQERIAQEELDLAAEEERLRLAEEKKKEEQKLTPQKNLPFNETFTKLKGYPMVTYPTVMIGQFMSFCMNIMMQRFQGDGVPPQMAYPAAGFTCSCIMDSYRKNNEQAEFQYEFTRGKAKDVPLFTNYLTECAQLSNTNKLFNQPQKTSR